MELIRLEFNAIMSASSEMSNRTGKTVSPAAVIAVIENETGPYGPFLPDGRPVVVFEGHVFWRELEREGISPVALISENSLVKVGNHEIDTTDLLYPRWDKRFHLDPASEWDQLERARLIHRTAANMSTSWGAFQIMGFNFPACGFSTVDEFVKAQETKLGQLVSFCRFVLSMKLAKFLVANPEPDFEAFALRYNGPRAAENKYAERMRASWERAKKKFSTF